MTFPKNLKIVQNTKHNDIISEVKAAATGALHVTNGTYAYPSSLIVPTVLAGFQYASDTLAAKNDTLLIAVNSDKSMNGILSKKFINAKTPADALMQLEAKANLEDQTTRAMKVAGPVAEIHPDKTVMVVFYDEETPTPLYDKMAQEGVALGSLFKYGYGTSPDAPRIEGAYNFQTVLAFPLVNDTKPLCHNITAGEDQSRFVKVVPLHATTGPHGAPYLSTNGKVLFDVPASLAAHKEPAATGNAPAPAPRNG